MSFAEDLNLRRSGLYVCWAKEPQPPTMIIRHMEICMPGSITMDGLTGSNARSLISSIGLIAARQAVIMGIHKVEVQGGLPREIIEGAELVIQCFIKAGDLRFHITKGRNCKVSHGSFALSPSHAISTVYDTSSIAYGLKESSK